MQHEIANTPEAPGIEAVLNSMSRNEDSLLELVELLTTKLSLVMIPETPSPDPGSLSSTAMSRSAFYESGMQISNGISCKLERLADIIKRIDI